MHQDIRQYPWPLRLLLALMVLMLSSGLAAQVAGVQGIAERDRLVSEMTASGIPGRTDLNEPPANTNWQPNAARGNIEPVVATTDIEPFGAALFSGGFRGLRADGLNQNYRIMPGDQVTLRIWGAVEIDRIMPVDAQGNIFIPGVGPVHVQGVTHAQLDSVVRRAVQGVYPQDVNVYTNLQGVQPIGVFVTGFVRKPGRYSAVPSDSVLYLLDQASGIDAELGSYRTVRLVRGGETIAQVDLYEFLLNGTLSHPQLQEGDTILVERRGSVVSVSGDVSRAHLYELLPEDRIGRSLIGFVGLHPGVSHALLRGIRDSGPYSGYQALQQFEAQSLRDGDEVQFFVDRRADSIVVQLEGSYLGSSYFVLPRGTTLYELLNGVAIDPRETAYESISIRRESVARQQQVALAESLRKLESTYLGASSSTVEESAIRVREAELISRFVAQARAIEPDGRLILAHQGALVDVRLQDRDVIILPPRTDAVLVTGEVFMPQSVVFVPDKTVLDYIEGAGGFSQHADPANILIARQNGEVRNARDVPLRPGDQIMVMPKVETKNLQLATSISQVLYQIAVAAKVALDL